MVDINLQKMYVKNVFLTHSLVNLHNLLMAVICFWHKCITVYLCQHQRPSPISKTCKTYVYTTCQICNLLGQIDSGCSISDVTHCFVECSFKALSLAIWSSPSFETGHDKSGAGGEDVTKPGLFMAAVVLC